MNILPVEFKFLLLFSAGALAFVCSFQTHAVSVQFQPVPPFSPSQEVSVSGRLEVNGVQQSIQFMELFRTGEQNNGETYGLMKDHLGFAAVSGKYVPYICSGNTPGVKGSGTDFSALLEKDDKTYLISQFECCTGGMYYAEVEQDARGDLSTRKSTLKFIDQSSEWGGWLHCAGSVTPWNTYLGGEEYEPDAKQLEGQDQYPTTNKNYNDKLRSYWLLEQNDTIVKSSPYQNGWITEVDINKNGEASYTKHYALGRFSHELAYVMPDQKTVYLTDDGTNSTLFMFVAKQPAVLSAGTLYAAQWEQTSGSDGGSAQLNWINLGYAESNKIRHAIATGIRFSDILQEDSDGCTRVAANGFAECIQVIPGQEVLASRLESRRYAACKGATHEFRKMEGFTFNPARNQAYIAISEVGRGMLHNSYDRVKTLTGKRRSYDPDNDPNNDPINYDDPNNDGKPETGNHIKLLKPDYCGAIYSLQMGEAVNDSEGNAIDSKYVALTMNSLLATGTRGGEVSPDECATRLDIMAQPDNISMLPGSNILIIAEDGKHTHPMVWSFNLDSRQLKRIATVPKGAESTSAYFYKLADNYYMTLVAQHPDRSEGNLNGDSITGAIGPIRIPNPE